MNAKSDNSSSQLLGDLRAAQALAFAPLLFAAAKSLRDRGILRLLHQRRPEGLTAQQVSQQAQLSIYGAKVLLEAGLAASLVSHEDGRFRLTRVGYLFFRDPMTRVNTNFTADVCYRAAEYLEASIDQGRAVGLQTLGDFPTVYEGLKDLPEPAKSSWFEFDHFYSDETFPLMLPLILAKRPSKLLDIGGNTGKFALQLLRADPEVKVTVADLPGQIAACRANLQESGLLERAQLHEISVLSLEATLPGDQDMIWMSQFLCCFSEPEIVHILQLARGALAKGGQIWILETFWNEQDNDVAELCLQATSLYFTTVANGNSRMYDSATFRRLLSEAGLGVQQETHHIGWGHSLLRCAAEV